MKLQGSKLIVRNTGILYAKTFITMGISLFSTRLILNALGATDFGVFFLIAGSITMLTFLNSAMASSTQRFMSYATGKGDADKQVNIFNISIVLHYSIALIVIIILEIAGLFLFNGVLQIDENRIFAAKIIYQILILSTTLTILTVPYDAILNAYENMLFYSITGILESILKLVIAFSLIYLKGDKLIIYGVSLSLVTFIILIIKRFYCHKEYKECIFNPRKYYDYQCMREMVSFAAWSFMGSFSSIISNYGQGIILNTFFGTIVNAAQGVTNQISGQLGIFANTMMKAVNPVIDKSEGANNRILMLKTTMTSSKLSFFLLILFYIPFFIELPFVFNIWLKEVPEYTILFCRLLLIRNMIEQLFVPLVGAIHAVGNIKNFQVYSSILGILPLPVSYYLFYLKFPPQSLYIVFIIYSIFASYIILFFAKRHCNLSISYFFNEVLIPCFLTFIFIFIFSLIPIAFLNVSYMRLIFVFCLSFIFFLIGVWFIGLSFEEKQLIKKILFGIKLYLKKLYLK